MNEPQSINKTGNRFNRQCAIVQIEGVHEVTIPFLIYTLNLQGWTPVVYINDRCKTERGDIFELCENLDFELHYTDLQHRADWGTLADKIRSNTSIEFIICNTFQLPNIAKYVSNFDLPIVGLVHNPELFLSSPEMRGFANKENIYLVTLWDHVSNSLRQGLEQRADNIATIKQTFLISNTNSTSSLFSSSNKIKIAITGAVDRRIRGLDGLFDLADVPDDSDLHNIKFVICGGGRDRVSFENEVSNRNLSEWFEFLDVDENTGNVPYDAYFEALASCDFIDTMLPTENRSYLEQKITSGILTAVSLGIPLIMDRATATVYQLPSILSQNNVRTHIQNVLETATKSKLHALRSELSEAREVFDTQNQRTLSRAIEQIMDTNMKKDENSTHSQSDFLSFCEQTLQQSSSQRLQDLWALYQSQFKRKGYFVEFGALNGHDVSNSWLLEKLGWDGIVSEPHPGYSDLIKKNRNCNVSTDCVFSETGKEIVFKAVNGRPALSTISMDTPDDSAEQNGRRDSFIEHKLKTISLEDLLSKYNAPNDIDFLSIDTEGSEYEILQNFNFQKYKFRTVCVEHNFTVHRELLYELFTKNGYTRKWETVSGHDDWYVLTEDSGTSNISQADIDWVTQRPKTAHEERRYSVLAGIFLELGQQAKSSELAQRSLALSPGYIEAKAILSKAASSTCSSANSITEAQPGRSSRNSDSNTTAQSLDNNMQQNQTTDDFLKAQYEFNMRMIDGFVQRSTNPNAKIAFSAAVQKLFWQLANTPEITKTLEIGAYEAGFSKKMKQARPDVEVIAFEANPFVYDHYKESVHAAGVDYRQVCVNSTGDETPIRIPLDYRGTDRKLTNQMSSIMNNSSTENTREVLVPGVCLDESLTLTEDDTIVAWIDVEGACGAVLPGCIETLKRCTAVYIEVESLAIWEDQWLAKDVAAFFASQGFFPVVKDFQSINQYNVVYINSNFCINLPVLRQFWTLIDQEEVFGKKELSAA